MGKIVQNDKIQSLEDKCIRTAWDKETKKRYLSRISLPAFLMAVAREGDEATEIARKAVEGRFGIPVITLKSAVQFNQVVVEMIEGNIVLSEEGIDS